jgi:hypothetical protein
MASEAADLAAYTEERSAYTSRTVAKFVETIRGLVDRPTDGVDAGTRTDALQRPTQAVVLDLPGSNVCALGVGLAPYQAAANRAIGLEVPVAEELGIRRGSAWKSKCEHLA